jgi:hypothetical protein
LFGHDLWDEDPYEDLLKYIGPENPLEWKQGELRHEYGGFSRFGSTAHPSDTVVHLAHPDRADYEANLLFMDFDKYSV